MYATYRPEKGKHKQLTQSYDNEESHHMTTSDSHIDKLDRLLAMITDSQSRMENIEKDLASLKSKQEEQD